MTAVESEVTAAPDFGDQARLAESLSGLSRGMHLSGILRTAQQVRELRAAGARILDFSIGDFGPKYFRIPAKLLRGVEQLSLIHI